MPSWYNISWPYRLPLTIDNSANSTSALSYHQVSLKLTSSAYASFVAHAKGDGSDLRITDSDGTTLLSFALEGIDTPNSTVYLLVKVPFVAAGASKTIYAYYGNAAATSVSSYANTVGPTTALTGPTDVYAQTDTANFNQADCLLRLQHQDGVNGGGAGLNGQLLAFNMVGANGNADRTNGSIGKMSSTDGGVTWGSKSVILAHDSTRCCEPRSACELADGTILLIYSADLPANASVSKSKAAVAKLLGGPVSGTWSNLSLTPGSLLSVPWTYNTDSGNPYHNIFTDDSGNLYAPAYGKIVADTGGHSWLLTCAAASDPTIGTNWTVKGTIAFDNVLRCSETAIAVLGGGNLVAVMRNDLPGVNPGLRTCSSTDWGATWTSPALLGEPGTISNASVSPDILKLASGNYLLTWGIRYGTDWGIGAAISTDNCATWFDRAPSLFVCNAGQTAGDGTYPNVVQNADGSICCIYYREVGGNVGTTNVVRTLSTEDWIVNSPNLYDGCESLSGFTAGANATISTTHVHNGTNAIKIDNSAGTGGTGDYVIRDWWSTNPALQGQKIAISYWSYETSNDTTRAIAIKDSTGVFNNANGNRIGAYVLGTSSDHLSWFDGASQHDTGTVVPANQWNKLSVRANVQASSVTGELRLNGTSVTTGLGQYGSGGNPQKAFIVGGSVGATHNVIYWLDDTYTHQYTASVPAVTSGSEQTDAATTYTITGPASGNINSATTITVSPDGAYTGTITITPSGGGLSTPTVLTFSNSLTPQTFTITPTASGTVTLTGTNSDSLSNPSPATMLVTASTFTFTGPNSGSINTASANFTVTPNASYTGGITITPSGGGLSTPIVLSFSNSLTPQTFTITPTLAGTVILTPTNTGGITNPALRTYSSAGQSLAVNPVNFYVSIPVATTFTGTGTTWLSTPPTITVTGAGSAGTTIGTVTVLSDTTATAVVTAGTTLGSMTFHDSTTSATTPANVAAATSTWPRLSAAHTFSGGLLGSVGYTILRSDGVVYATRATAGVFTVGTSGYAAFTALPISGSFIILWDNGSGVTEFEVINTTGVEPSSVAIPGGLNMAQAMSLILSLEGGTVSGYSGTFPATLTYKAPDNTTTRITGTTDGQGNRGLPLTLNPPL